MSLRPVAASPATAGAPAKLNLQRSALWPPVAAILPRAGAVECAKLEPIACCSQGPSAKSAAPERLRAVAPELWSPPTALASRRRTPEPAINCARISPRGHVRESNQTLGVCGAEILILGPRYMGPKPASSQTLIRRGASVAPWVKWMTSISLRFGWKTCRDRREFAPVSTSAISGSNFQLVDKAYNRRNRAQPTDHDPKIHQIGTRSKSRRPAIVR
jgi:hypothetical protein